MENRFRPLDHHLSFSIPDRLTNVPSWHQHIPFAMALVGILRPHVLVELGTYRGDSYLAMCQAVDALGIATRCYAVDTWKGDDHSGFYGDNIFEELSAYHDQRYGRFSTLVRSTFDEALGHFPDGAIDILHIDGLHTSEAVRHDFDAWRPKLSGRAVVLIHDTNVRERGFGVWRFWEEESGRYPSFEFAHGHGLGVLAVGPEASTEILDLCRLGESDRRTVCRFYEALGERISHLAKVRVLGASLAECRERIRQLEVQATRSSEHIRQLEAEATSSAERSSGLEREAACLHERLAKAIRDGGETPLLLSRSQPNHAARRAEELQLVLDSGLFNAAWYLSNNPDVAAAGVDPLVHFYDNGAREGRDPNPWFDTSWYVENVSDVAASGLNPLVHYLKRGARELRDPHPKFCAVRYLAEHPELERDERTPLAHFLKSAASGSAAAADAR